MLFFGLQKNVCIFFLMIMKFISTFLSPFGQLVIHCSGQGVTKIEFSEDIVEEKESQHSFLARKELFDYFDGRLQKFTVQLDLTGHSDFHQTVWNELQQLPYGKTCSYKELAHKINNENAVRAVGRANGLNPIPFIIPCHRVIGSDGSLTGYAWGLEMKQKLLHLENPISFPLQKTLFS